MKTIYSLFLILLFYSCKMGSEKIANDSSKEFIYYVSRDVKTDKEELNYVDLSDYSIHNCSAISGINYFDIASDSSSIAYNRFRQDGTHPELYLFNIKKGTEKVIDSIGFIPKISPDNKYIIYRTLIELVLVDNAGENKEILVKGIENKGHLTYFKSPVWSNDGEFIYFAEIETASIADTTNIPKISVKRISIKTKIIENIVLNFNTRTLRIAQNSKDELFAYEQINNGKRFEENIVRFRKNQSSKWEKELILTEASDMFDVSPNGKNLVFMKDSVIQDTIRYGWHLFVYNIDSKKTKQITFGSQSCDWPVWKSFRKIR